MGSEAGNAAATPTSADRAYDHFISTTENERTSNTSGQIGMQMTDESNKGTYGIGSPKVFIDGPLSALQSSHGCHAVRTDKRIVPSSRAQIRGFGGVGLALETLSYPSNLAESTSPC
jgi:hypothetical protein